MEKKKICEVLESDLPLSCPSPKDAIWDLHPRVCLPIEKTGTARCYYCSTEYILIKSTKN